MDLATSLTVSNLATARRCLVPDGPSLAACNNDGPIFAMRNSTLATLAFSTMDHFASQVVNTIGDGFGVNAMGAAVPDGTTMSTVLLARPGVNRAARAWGTTPPPRLPASLPPCL